MRSILECFLIALVVTLKPGLATALVLRVAARDGRRARSVQWAGTLLRPRVRRTMERVTGVVMIAFGISIAAESR